MATITVNFIDSEFIPYPFKYQFLSNQNSLLADFRNPRKLITLKIQCCTKTSPNKKPRKPPMDKSNSSKNPNSKRAPNRRRSSTSYGTSRKSVLKKSFSQEQVYFSGPVSNDPVVGIIGGGMAGLICALYLEKRGIRSTVFDTGLHGLGGRMATRIIDPEPLIFDHAAQFFTVTDPEFAKLVHLWSEKGLVREWHGTVGELEAGGHFTPLPSSPPRYIGANGMRPLADTILSQTHLVNVVRPCWVSTLEPFNGMWHLSEKGKNCGQFDAIVIAHNGKCANRLLASSGLPLIARQMKRLNLSSIWALLAAFKDPLPLPASATAFPFEGAFVKGVDSISWMADNTKKFLGSHSHGPHCWTFLSTATFGKQNKVPQSLLCAVDLYQQIGGVSWNQRDKIFIFPTLYSVGQGAEPCLESELQESIPVATAQRVQETMLADVEYALGLPKSSIQTPIFSRVQLWGAALPLNTPNVPCIFDPHGRAGICGDWLLGSSLEAAALSGMALANHIADYLQSGGQCPDEFAVGLCNEFQPLRGHDIGQFPGLQSEEHINKPQAVQLSA